MAVSRITLNILDLSSTPTTVTTEDGLKPFVSMATIKAIESHSVHQIQSGQVIVDLNSVVKELVENGIDAGATSIEVRFKNHGLDSIEIQDNGNGIAPEDFETLALKHHTSKLSDYDDLTDLNTFGFRGEALSSLCAVSKNFHVLTARAEDGAVGKKLQFDMSGKLTGTSVSSAQKGTTVYVEELFCTLPVRRKELEKNIKREYGKVISLLYQYACVSVGVRFSVSNQMPKGKKVLVFSTKSNTTTKENITNVFGAKTLLALLRLDLHLDMAPSTGPSTQGARNWSTQATDRSMVVHVDGHISKPVFGEGRQAPDRQMYFVNGRPCQLPQISKAFNEVYKSFNVSQSPFVFANLIMDTNSYDVNVSPDKRTIMLHDQAALIDSLKDALKTLFEETDHTVPQSTLPNRKLPSYQPLTVQRRSSTHTPTPDKEDEGNDSGDGTSSSSPVTRDNGAPSGESPLNLISNWVGRDTEERKPSKRQNNVSSKGKANLLQAMKQKDLDTAVRPPTADSAPEFPSVDGESNDPMITDDVKEPTVSDSRPESHPIDAVHNPAPLSSSYGDLFSQPPPEVTRPVRDFNNALEQIRAQTNAEPESASKTDSANGSDMPPPSTIRRATSSGREPPIPVTTPGSMKTPSGPVANAFERMRPLRTSQQIAEITIGDVTTTTVIGSSPPYKKRRIHRPDDSQRVAQYGASPSLARGLRKSFAAPGSQLEADAQSSAVSLPDLGPEEQSEEEIESDLLGDDDERTKTAPTARFSRRATSVSTPESQSSDPLDDLALGHANDDPWDEDYMDEEQKKIREDEKVAQLIQEAEENAARPTDENLKRAAQMLKNGVNRKDSTLNLEATSRATIESIKQQLAVLISHSEPSIKREGEEEDEASSLIKEEIDSDQAESRLSLTVTKPDFARMHIIGQFNLGFILAIRPSADDDRGENDLFIIDQHASDEKYNYERLQRTVTLQAQRLVRPKALELTAIEEEVVLNNIDALTANGFQIETASSSALDEDEEPAQTGRRCRLITLPMSKEKTFDLSDLEELLHLLSEQQSGSAEIPRPRKVQRMLAMRACRSSIMVGKTLTLAQMGKVVRHMGEMEKPWNCPHGRPTMRHLAGLKAWKAWEEGEPTGEYDGPAKKTDWESWLAKRSK